MTWSLCLCPWMEPQAVLPVSPCHSTIPQWLLPGPRLLLLFNNLSEFPINSSKGNGKTQKKEQHLLTQLANQSNLLKQIHESIYMHVFILEDKRSLLILPYWKITNFWCFLEFLIELCLMIYLIEKLLKKAFKPWLSYIHWSTFIWNVCHF